MNVLTIVQAIFVPLTLIAGIYGMNFVIMPELQWPWAYHAVLALMAVAAVASFGFSISAAGSTRSASER